MKKLLLSSSGRIPRSTWWWSMIGTWIVFTVLYQGLAAVGGAAATWILYPFLYWILAVLCIKRLHDRAHSGWALLWAVIPVLGVLWLAIQLALLPGSRGENQFGEDPLGGGLDYLVVS